MSSRYPPAKTMCRFGVLGRATCMDFSFSTNACIVTTMMNGAHVFHLDDDFYGTNLCTGLSSRCVESYSSEVISADAVLSTCFLCNDSVLAFGSVAGSVTLVSRQSRGLIGSYMTKQPSSPMHSLHPIPDNPSSLLLCTSYGAEIVHLDSLTLSCALPDPAPRAVGAVALSSTVFAVANYDGKVLLHDTRAGYDPFVILSIPDQITTFAACGETGRVCAGTVAGRVFALRCLTMSMREEAFGIGATRSPIVSLSVRQQRLATGDLSGRLALVDVADVADPTIYWSAEMVLCDRVAGNCSRGSEEKVFGGGGEVGTEGEGDENTMQGGAVRRRGAEASPAKPRFADMEVTATTLTDGLVWASFHACDDAESQVVVLPA